MTHELQLQWSVKYVTLEIRQKSSPQESQTPCLDLGDCLEGVEFVLLPHLREQVHHGLHEFLHECCLSYSNEPDKNKVECAHAKKNKTVTLEKTNSGKKTRTCRCWRLVGGCSWSLTDISDFPVCNCSLSICPTVGMVWYFAPLLTLPLIPVSTGFFESSISACEILGGVVTHSWVGLFVAFWFFFCNLYESLVQTSALWFWRSRRFVLIFLRDLLMEVCLSCPNLINISLALLVIVLDFPSP